ncbi:two-component system response regulator CreB [Comamonas serinivorans]|uniref:Two-component system response regulator CreB n=1 Tax=Comamonas serinivorans TaxID=1082851 RepID=A0A1Y0EIY0_9BURK|nr:two-component system response regulator CreB [Comamonas serinivorans]ARU03371.1 two-component system response regulator CreB [Comamonas serinivorans]
MLDKPLILLVEDEAAIADTLRYMLTAEGFEAVWCATGQAALQAFALQTPSLAILDVGLPDISGFDLFRKLQALPGGRDTPMLFLTARSDEIDAVVGLELGADDYVTKPFSPRELMARVRMILRRHAKPAAVNNAPELHPIDFQLDLAKRRVTACGQPLDLSRYEYGVLALLLKQPGRVFTRNDLLEQVWDDPGESLDRTVDAHIKTLRAKLREVPELPDCIKTLRGVGYALDDTQDLHIVIV